MMYPKTKRKAKKRKDMKALFREIWNERPHICTNCGDPISRPVAHVFSHKKSKGAWPSLATDKENIELHCSTLTRTDGDMGCHECKHTNPELYKQRKNEH